MLPHSPRLAFPPMVNEETVTIPDSKELGQNFVTGSPSALPNAAKTQETLRESDLSASLPRESVETWLSRAADAEVTTSSLSRKRKHSHSSTSTSTPHTPTQLRETSEELKELEIKMQTPNKSTSTPENLTTPNTANQKAKAKAKEGKVPVSVIWVRGRLRDHGMYQRDHQAFAKYPEFQEQARAIVGKNRDSPVNDSSVQKLQEKWEYFESDNEDTLIDNLLPCIIKDTRSVPPQDKAGTSDGASEAGPQHPSEKAGEASVPGADETYPDAIVKRDFWDDGIIRKRNCNFLESFLPIDEDLTKALAKAEGLTNPRPDCIYGLNTNKYPPRPKGVKTSAETQRIRGIVQNMYDPALVIEGKSARGEEGEAVNQACRDGAALVNAARLLRERIGDPDVEGADRRTFVYTAAMGSRDMEVFVNWAEVLPADAEGDKVVLYHMNQLNIHSYSREGFLQENRDIFHNILDWASVSRHQERIELYGRVFDWEKQQKESGSQGGNKRPRTG